LAVILEPYTGINYNGKMINFNMTQKEVKIITGEESPKIEIDNIMKEINEYRSGMIFTYINNKLAEITFSLHVELFIKGIEIFKSENLIEELKKYDEQAEGTSAYSNFYKLGISVGGFGKKKIPEKKLIIAFCKDRMEWYKLFING
jgi:hypothetical protein